MPDPPPPPPPPGGSLPHIVVTWLTSITTWKRTGIALVLGSGLLVGALTYRNERDVVDLLRWAIVVEPMPADQSMTFYESDVQRHLQSLLGNFAPAMIWVTAWRITLAENRLQFVRAAALPEFVAVIAQLEAERWHWPIPLFSDYPSMNDAFARLYIGRFVCLLPGEIWPESLARFPIGELCLVAIPPDGVGLAGLVAGAWRVPVTTQERARVETAFRLTAAALVWRAARPAEQVPLQ